MLIKPDCLSLNTKKILDTGQKQAIADENTTRTREANLGPASDGGEAATCVVGRGEEIRVAWMALAILLGTAVILGHTHVRRHEATPQSGRLTSSRTERTAARCLLKTRFACTVVQLVSKQRAHSRPFDLPSAQAIQTRLRFSVSTTLSLSLFSRTQR